jgi:hypothetical protein
MFFFEDVFAMTETLKTDFELAIELQSILINKATGEKEGVASDIDYQGIRTHLLQKEDIKSILPSLVQKNRNLDQFWQFIKLRFATYAERRECIYSEFSPLLDFLEQTQASPSDPSISDRLRRFDEENVHAVWAKAIARRATDPEGAITSARTLLETVCKHILDEQGVEYDAGKIKLPQLYSLTAIELNLAPNQHSEEVFKQILGSVTGVVNGLGTLRNRLSDAHGKGKQAARPHPRHAELAVNLAGSMAVFLVSTWEARQTEQSSTGQE